MSKCSVHEDIPRGNSSGKDLNKNASETASTYSTINISVGFESWYAYTNYITAHKETGISEMSNLLINYPFQHFKV